MVEEHGIITTVVALMEEQEVLAVVELLVLQEILPQSLEQQTPEAEVVELDLLVLVGG